MISNEQVKAKRVKLLSVFYYHIVVWKKWKINHEKQQQKKKKKNTTLSEQFQYQIKILHRGKINTPNTQIHGEMHFPGHQNH